MLINFSVHGYAIKLLIMLFCSENFVFLQIGYKALSYELHEQKVAFGTEALLGIYPSFLFYSFH